MRYWLGVVSEKHVNLGRTGGFAQVCHGKRAPLARMQSHDWLIYYSPSRQMGQADGFQSFTAIGRMRDHNVYRVTMTPDFSPFRRDVEYFQSRYAPLSSIKGRLEFTRSSNWGMSLRRGLIEISAHDFKIIAEAMGVEVFDDENHEPSN